MLHLLKGDWAKARSLVEHWITMLRTGNVAILLPWAVASSAWALAQIGEAGEALNRVREGEQLLELQAAQGNRRPSRLGLSRGGSRLSAARPARRGAAPGPIARSNPLSASLASRPMRCDLLGDIATHPDRFDAESGAAHYREALALAELHGMRPLVAHCHLGLGKLYRRTGKPEQARENLTAATTMYREMDMRFWLEQAS